MSVLFASLIDATLILGLGLALAAALRRRSAAVRHAVLTTAIVCAAVMPALELMVPQLPVRWIASTAVSSGLGFSSGESVVVASADAVAETTGQAIDWPVVVAALWAATSLVTLAGLAIGLWRLHWLRAACVPAGGSWRTVTDELALACGVSRPVKLLQSNDPTLLVTYGMFKPGIILPAGAEGWTDDRRRIVLRHELAHIRRRDAAIQVAGELLRVVQPFNPLVWVACRRLRQESEYACDDAVLGAGVEATDYASHLFGVAKQLSGQQTVWATAPAVAHPSTLERRIVAMLQPQNNRQPVTRAGWAVVALLALGISLPVAAIGLSPQLATVGPGPAKGLSAPAVAPPAIADPAPAVRSTAASAAPVRRNPAPRQTSLSGYVQDQTGGRIPGATMTVTNQQTQEQHRAVTSAPGKFEFNLPAAMYELTAELSGFRKVRVPVDLAAAAPTILTITMPVGALSEAIVVQCASVPSSILQMFFPTLSAQEPPSAPIRIGGSIKPPRKTKDVRPVCPTAGVTGEVVVLLEGRIGVDGVVTDIRPIAAEGSVRNDAVPAALIESATDAVRQWEFSPTLLNGRPVDVVITVSVTFKSA